MVITTDKCEQCVYGQIEEVSKAEIYICCQQRDKKYFYGQSISCEDFKKKG